MLSVIGLRNTIYNNSSNSCSNNNSSNPNDNEVLADVADGDDVSLVEVLDILHIISCHINKQTNRYTYMHVYIYIYI